MADEGLVDPTDGDAVRLSDATVPESRPIMFGDVFADVPCSRGGAPESYVMVMTHPCSMRNGATLRSSVVTAQVTKFPGGKVKDQTLWRSRFFDYFPLVGFNNAHPQEPCVVRLGELHAARTADLDVAKRAFALSNYGVASVLQRWMYQLSRDPVPIAVLEELIAPAMTEAELEEEWCQAALDAGAMPIKDASSDFQTFLGLPHAGGLRDALLSGDISALARVRRDVRVERRSRFGA